VRTGRESSRPGQVPGVLRSVGPNSIAEGLTVSGPPTTPPPGREPTPRSQLNNALFWLIASLLIATFAFYRGAEQEEKRTFYIIAGVVAVISVVINGYAAWLAYQKSKTPPAA
jgi:hypothetical protein